MRNWETDDDDSDDYNDDHNDNGNVVGGENEDEDDDDDDDDDDNLSGLGFCWVSCNDVVESRPFIDSKVKIQTFH